MTSGPQRKPVLTKREIALANAICALLEPELKKLGIKLDAILVKVSLIKRGYA